MVLQNPGAQKFTLVISQFEKSTTIYYTLRVYSTIDFTLTELKDNFQHKLKVNFDERIFYGALTIKISLETNVIQCSSMF